MHAPCQRSSLRTGIWCQALKSILLHIKLRKVAWQAAKGCLDKALPMLLTSSLVMIIRRLSILKMMAFSRMNTEDGEDVGICDNPARALNWQ